MSDAPKPKKPASARKTKPDAAALDDSLLPAPPADAKGSHAHGAAAIPDSAPRVLLFTDGACSGNPGPGGWAYILKHPASGKVRKDAGGQALTTNNQMELTGAIMGLKALTRPSVVELYSDSEYVLKGLREWVTGWKKRGWKTAAKQPVKNRELWEELDNLRSGHRVTMHWVRGHDGHPENEECDQMAVRAARVASGKPEAATGG
ncbi:MAG: ribonuclease HI [Phycisphaerales bacterium]|nr:ribonuclease HI [Phycisphaerales bacterium]